MEFKDYYKVLGVERTASEDEVKKASESKEGMDALIEMSL